MYRDKTLIFKTKQELKLNLPERIELGFAFPLIFRTLGCDVLDVLAPKPAGMPVVSESKNRLNVAI